VAEAFSGKQLKCFRLDEARPAGRITERLLQELQAATLCVADLSGCKPNAMWEVGYVMALGKPTIIVTQDKGEIPFDIHDMLRIQYDRNHLSDTLGRPLKRAVLDTISIEVASRPRSSGSQATEHEALVGELLEQIRDLKSMMSEAVKSWSPSTRQANDSRIDNSNLSALEGAWVNVETGSYLYARMVEHELVAPYCYGANNWLTGAYYGWKRTGDYWFTRFRWFTAPISGFAFLKQESFDLVTGAWWLDDGVQGVPEFPVMGSGVPSRLERLKDAQFPDWAQRFFDDVRREGLVARLTKHCT
jgi:hypothetical protein